MGNKFLVLDFTRLLPGPFATYILSHLGGEVIKIEDTKGGDMARYTFPHTPEGHGALFSLLNVGKKSVAVDLKSKEGLEIVKMLIEKADVLVEGFRPGVMRKLGLGFDEVKKINPKIIYCSISGYGQTGPLAHKSGHDLNYISLAGIERLMISEEKGIAVPPPIQIADLSGGLFAVIGILKALYEKERNKDRFEATFIDISMVETSLFLAVYTLSIFLATEEEPKPFGEVLTGGITCYNVYKTKDGKWLSIGALEPKFWQNLVEALGMQDELLPSDAMTSAQDENPAYRKLKEKISSLTSKEIERLFEGKDIPYEFVGGYKDAMEHPHIKEREVFYKADKNQVAIKLPFMNKVKGKAPELGQHTQEILKELGYPEERIKELREKGVIL